MSQVVNERTGVHSNWTRPPPRGATPRLIIFNEVSSIPNFFNNGIVTVRKTSTEESKRLHVTPESVMLIGFFEKGARQASASKKYPIPLSAWHSCSSRRPPIIVPGLYFRVVPVSLISIFDPLESVSIKRKKFASNS
eukprot:434095_1